MGVDGKRHAPAALPGTHYNNITYYNEIQYLKRKADLTFCLLAFCYNCTFVLLQS